MSLAAIRASLEFLIKQVLIIIANPKAYGLSSLSLQTIDTDRIKIITPNHRGCQISLRILNSDKYLFKQITNCGVISDWREPDVIRIAPVPLYNSFLDVWSFYNILNKLLSEK